MEFSLVSNLKELLISLHKKEDNKLYYAKFQFSFIQSTDSG